MYWGTLMGGLAGCAGGYMLVDRKAQAKTEDKEEKKEEPDQVLEPALEKVLKLLPEEERIGETGEALRSCVTVFADMTALVQAGDPLNATLMLTDVTHNMNLATALVAQCRQGVASRNGARPEFARDFTQKAREWLTAMEDRAVFLRSKLSAK